MKKMAKFDSLPVRIQQNIQILCDSSTPEHIRFNYFTSLKNIRDACNEAITKYEKDWVK